MNIIEIPPEKKIKLSKFNFSCDDKDTSIPIPLCQTLNFFYLVCGRPGSGKTSLILNLLAKRNRNYNRKFNKIYLFSPSMATLKDNPFEELPDDQVYDELNNDDFVECLETIKDSGERVLFILDDCVNDMRGKDIQKTLCKSLMNRRHLCGAGGSCSFLITTQVYNKVPLPIRKTASHIFLYHTRNKKEIETIFDECILISKEKYYEILKYVFDKKHNFLYLDLDKDLDEMFHKNFNKLVFK